MSKFRGHVCGAVVGFVGYLFLLGRWARPRGRWEVALLLLICLLAALWPDVDTRSKGQNIFYGAFLLIDIFLLYRGDYRRAAFLGLFALLPIVGRHRGWTHTLWAMALIPLPLLLIPMLACKDFDLSGLPYYLAGVTGYFSHLLLDRKFL